jgi:hypothetical protein
MYDIEGAAACREDTTTPFGDQGQIAALEKAYQFLGEKKLETLTQEAAVLTETAHEIVKGGGVGQVASTFAADADLSPGSTHFFKQKHPGASLGGPAGGH